MPKVHKTISEAEANLRAATAFIPDRYRTATQKAVWAEPAASDQAEENWRAGLAEAQAADRRRIKIREAGDTTYRKGCAEKGYGVIATRITAALGLYRSAFAPILEAMCAASDAAPARVRDWRANVTNRLFPVIEAAKRAAGKPV